MANIKILITGGSGFIGTNLIESLRSTNSTLLNLDIRPPLNPAHATHWKFQDILVKEALCEAFRTFQPDHVIHLAARADCDENTTVEEGYRANTEGTSNVIAAIQSCPSVSRTVITSTQYVHGPGHLPTDDEDYEPHTVYGQSKVLTEKITRQANLSCTWTIIRPTNVWGPWHLRYRREFLRVLRTGLYLHPGGAACIKSYAYVGNVVNQIRGILEAPIKDVSGATLYVGDNPLALLDWVNAFSLALLKKKTPVIPRSAMIVLAKMGDIISSMTGKPFLITTSRYQSMVQDYNTPMQNTFAILGPVRHSLDDGVRLTLEWLKAYDAAQKALR